MTTQESFETTMQHIKLERYAFQQGDILRVICTLPSFNGVPVYLVEMKGFCFAGYVPAMDLYMVGRAFLEVLTREEQEATMYHEEGHRMQGNTPIDTFEEYVASELDADAYAKAKGYGITLANTLIKSFTLQFGSLENLDKHQKEMLNTRVAALRAAKEAL